MNALPFFAVVMTCANVVSGQTQLSDEMIRSLGGDPVALREEALKRQKEAPSADGLSHPLGARWGSNCRAQTHRLIFTKQSEAASELAGSVGFTKVIDQVINDNVGDLIIAAGGNTGTVQSDPIYFNNKSVNFAVTDPYSKAHVAIGKGRFGGELTVTYQVISATQIEVEMVECDASCFDLYDFAYGAPAINILWISIDPKNPTMLQAGHASLASGSASESGKVFFTQVDLETSRFWNHQVYPKL